MHRPARRERVKRARLDVDEQLSRASHYYVKLIGYNASKPAVHMLPVQLAWELRGTKVKVNSTNPGFTKQI